MSRGNFAAGLEALGAFESGRPSGDPEQYRIQNTLGFTGKYQFGEALLIDLGYYQADTYYGNGAGTNLWQGTWTAKAQAFGVNSIEDFRNSPEIQEAAIRDAFEFNWKIIDKVLGEAGKTVEDFIGQTLDFNDRGTQKTLTFTPFGILAGAHLRGPYGLANLLLDGTVSVDEYGTSILRYINEYAGYDVPEDITGGAVPNPPIDIIPTTLNSGESFMGTDGVADVFSFTWSWGKSNLIENFDPIEDVVDLKKFWLPDSNQVQILDSNQGVVIDLTDVNNQTIILKGISKSQLTANNFQGLPDADTVLDNPPNTGEPTPPTAPTPMPAPMPTISIDTTSVMEGDSGKSNAIFTVELSAVSEREITVNYNTVDGNADSMTDFVAKTGTLTFAPGETSKTISIEVNGDTTVEMSEDFYVELDNAVNASILDGRGDAIIVNDDRAPTTPTNPPTPTTPSNSQVVVVDENGADILNFNTATDKIDFGSYSVHSMIITEKPEGVTFDNPWNNNEQTLVGISLKDLSVDNFLPIANNHLREDVGGVLAWETGNAVIKPNTVYVRSHEVNKQEVVAFNSATDTISFLYYGGRETLVMRDTPEGVEIATEATGQSLILKDTKIADLSPANFEFHFSQIREDNLDDKIRINATNDQIVSRDGIFDPGGSVDYPDMPHNHPDGHNHPDPMPMPPPEPMPAPEPMPTPTPMEFSVDGQGWGNGFGGNITLTNTSTTETVDGWDVEFDSFHEITTLWNGQFTKSSNPDGSYHYVISNPNWKTTLLPGESFSVGFNANAELGTQVVGTLDPNSFTNFVLNGAADQSGGTGGNPIDPTPNDPITPSVPTISIDDVSILEGNSGKTNAVFNVELSAVSDQAVTINYNTVDNTADSVTDFIDKTGTLTFAPGETSKTITVEVQGDTQIERTENFYVQLDGAVNAEIVDNQAVGTIRNDDRAPNTGGNSQPVVGAYYPEWAIYGRDYQVVELPAKDITHAFYAFAKINNDGEVAVFDSWAATDKRFDGDWNTPKEYAGNYEQLNNVKAANPHLKTLISIGGWTLSGKFSDVALTDASREKFAKSAVNFMTKYGFDGLDIDWEYPVSGGLASNTYRPQDKQNYTLLLQELDEQLQIQEAQDNRDYLLTIASPAGFDKIQNYELGAMSQYLDFFNVMTYDYNGAWQKTTGHNAPLYANPNEPSANGAKYNVDYTIQTYLNEGVPADKIVLGAPAYGRTWTGVGSDSNGLFQSATGAGAGTWEQGVIDYNDLYNKVQTDSNYQVYWDDASKVPYVYNAQTGFFSTYENVESMSLKLDYIKENNLRGTFFWDASSDIRDSNDPNSLIGLAADSLVVMPSKM